MPLKIVRNDITKMVCDAIVNTANDQPTVGTGCDYAVYTAAGYDQLLAYRKEHIGFAEEGSVFLTPGFGLNAKYIIHAVSPLYIDGQSGEEEKLRSCYRQALVLAQQNEVKSIAFPLISTGGFGYPKEEGMRIAVDEINAFLMQHEMLIFLVVFGKKATSLGTAIYPRLRSYIDQNYVREKRVEEYGAAYAASEPSAPARRNDARARSLFRRRLRENGVNEEASAVRPKPAAQSIPPARPESTELPESSTLSGEYENQKPAAKPVQYGDSLQSPVFDDSFYEDKEQALAERMRHISDTFSQYLLYLIESKGMTNAEVYKRAIVDKKTFSKIKNNVNAHPQKMTAMCLCVGAKLNLDETKDLLARAGYALSPCDKTDIIFSFFIENEIYDMIELDIQLEEHGLPCLIS